MNQNYLKQKKILLVDDEQELLDMVVSILKEDGYTHIATAKTAAEGAKSAQKNPPDRSALFRRSLTARFWCRLICWRKSS